MRGLQVAQAAVLDVRDPAARQLQLEQVGVVSRAREHRLLAQQQSVLAVGQDLVADELRLL